VVRPCRPRWAGTFPLVVSTQLPRAPRHRLLSLGRSSQATGLRPFALPHSDALSLSRPEYCSRSDRSDFVQAKSVSLPLTTGAVFAARRRLRRVYQHGAHMGGDIFDVWRPYRSGACHLSRLFVEEPCEGGRETLGMLDLGQVPAVGYELEGAVSQPGDRLVGLGGGEYPVALSPHH
jgi:hypothetical protein